MRRVLFLSGCPGDTRRYRVLHAAEALELAGGVARVRRVEGSWSPEELQPGEVLVLHRVAWDEAVAALVAHARRIGSRVLFDTDDLIFQAEAEPRLAALRRRHGPASDRFLASVVDYQRTLEACDGCLVSTASLAAAAERFGQRAAVAGNAISLELLRLSTEALVRRARQAPREADRLVLGYASGTPTHDRDFAVIGAVLRELLDADPRLVLQLIGPVMLDPDWEPYAGRIRRLDLVPWRRLPGLLAELDINLAPLEIGEPFCEAKSALKYFEAGAVGVPTVAAATAAFCQAISPGASGYVAADPASWRAALEALLGDAAHRRTVGLAARDDVVGRFTADAPGPGILAAVEELLDGQPRRPGLRLTVVAPDRSAAAPVIAALRDGLSAGTAADVTLTVAPSAPGGPPAPEPAADAVLAAGVAAVAATEGSAGGRRFLLAADDEALQQPMSPAHVAAERVYRSGLPVMALGPWLSRRLDERYGAASWSIAYPIDLRLFHPGPLRRSMRVVYEVTAPVPPGVLDLGLAALKCLQMLCPKAEIFLYGQAAHAPAVNCRHTWLGPLEDAARADVFRHAAALLAPVFTNAPPAVPEAMACGCAVVAVDSPAVAWLLIDRETALLAPPSEEALAEALERVLTDPDLFERITTGAYSAVELMSRTRCTAGVVAGLQAAVAGPDTVTEPDGMVRLDQLQAPSTRAGPLVGGERTAGQSFVARGNGLCRVDLMLAPDALPPAGPLSLCLWSDPLATEELARAELPPVEVSAEEWLPFRFEPIPDSAGRRFYARLEYPAGRAHPVRPLRSDQTTFYAGHAYVDDRAQAGSLAFRTFCRAESLVAGIGARGLDDPFQQRITTLATTTEDARGHLEALQHTWPYRVTHLGAIWAATAPLPPLDERPWPADAPARAKLAGSLRHYGLLALLKELIAWVRWRRMSAAERRVAEESTQ